MNSRPFFNKFVFVVDDNETNREIAAGLLKNFGCTVDIAENGQEAVEMATLTPYDLILMDCQMPVMDGFKATKTIRRMEKDTNICNFRQHKRTGPGQMSCGRHGWVHQQAI